MMMSALITGEQCKASSRRRAPPQLFWTRPMLDVDDLWFKPANYNTNNYNSHDTITTY